MKSVKIFALATGIFLAQSAMAFITVIEVHKPFDRVKTVRSAADANIEELRGKHMTYRGLANEALALVEEIIRQDWPEQLARVSSEINPVSGTIVVTVTLSGWGGTETLHFVLKKGGV